jgi:hypothetical protein
MWKTLGCAILMLGSAGCFIEDDDHHHHHGHRAAVVEPGHVHGAGCGHVLRDGVWCDPD